MDPPRPLSFLFSLFTDLFTLFFLLPLSQLLLLKSAPPPPKTSPRNPNTHPFVYKCKVNKNHITNPMTYSLFFFYFLLLHMYVPFFPSIYFLLHLPPVTYLPDITRTYYFVRLLSSSTVKPGRE
ncbi:hypothetical protein F5H01DRAFT_114720 [Linnemannia elongata]|nr:hypothetical protein F5H01DRAFT_114720 [Linnemannia elongata]